MKNQSERISRTDALKLIDEPGKFGRSLGCGLCQDVGLCGGLHTAKNMFDCKELCQCDDEESKGSCQRACPFNLDTFNKRFNEVGGWELTVDSTEIITTPELPCYIPIIKDANKRRRPLKLSAVALRLDTLIAGDWRKKCSPLNQLASHFKIDASSNIIINGVGFDAPLERYWRHPDRTEMAESISRLNPLMMTTPNFSLFTDVPRWENLYNMKRIALIWHELADAGIPAALHLNARTAQDWKRWREFLAAHPEIRLVSFEFGTGANGKRRDWYVAHLKRTADEAMQPLALVMRGGVSSMQLLSESFDQVSLLSMNAFMKTIKRRRLYSFGGRLRERKVRTRVGTPLDELLAENILAEHRFVRTCLGRDDTIQRLEAARAG